MSIGMRVMPDPRSVTHKPFPRLDSVIVPTLPDLFAEFRGKRFSLLWRGGRDGFGARDFHSRCDGHANTLTVILDTNGNIFGGFTPVEWKSSTHVKFKADASLKSFLFTLKNPHNVPARRFALRPENIVTVKVNAGALIVDRRTWDVLLGCCFDMDLVGMTGNPAICWASSRGPCFWDIDVFDNCNTNSSCWAFHFGTCYINDTGLDGKTFFTGSRYFQVNEIEVFEITD
jgi:hypothetical protein